MANDDSKAIRAKGLGILVGVAAAVGGVGFLVAWLMGSHRVSTAESQCDERVEKVQAQLGESEEREQQLRQKLDRVGFERRVLAAGRQLYRAVLALEQRNFGTAQEHMTRAGRLLAQAKSQADAAGVAEVQQQAESWDPAVTQNVGQQRQQVLNMAKKLEAIVGEDAGQ